MSAQSCCWSLPEDYLTRRTMKLLRVDMVRRGSSVTPRYLKEGTCSMGVDVRIGKRFVMDQGRAVCLCGGKKMRFLFAPC